MIDRERDTERGIIFVREERKQKEIITKSHVSLCLAIRILANECSPSGSWLTFGVMCISAESHGLPHSKLTQNMQQGSTAKRLWLRRKPCRFHLKLVEIQETVTAELTPFKQLCSSLWMLNKTNLFIYVARASSMHSAFCPKIQDQATMNWPPG